MTLKWVFVFELLVVSLPFFSATKYNVSVEDIQTYDCVNYTTQDTFLRYEEKFFKIDDFQHTQKRADGIVNLNVFVLADNLASILLTTTETPTATTPAYHMIIDSDEDEIVLRNAMYGPYLAVQSAENILSPADPLPLNIRVSKQGEMTVKINGMDKILINATVQNPFPVQYVAFSGLSSLKANQIYFDCKINIYKNLEDAVIELEDLGSSLSWNYSHYSEKTIVNEKTNSQSDSFLFSGLFYLFCFIVFILIVIVVIKKRQPTRTVNANF